MQGTENKEREKDCMSLDGVSRAVCWDSQHMLGEGFSVTVQNIPKNNAVILKGIIIQEEGYNLSPTIYLEWYYHKYTLGYSLSELEKMILDVYYENRPLEKINTQFFTDWEQAKKRIVYKLINYKRNADILQNVPYVRFLDLAVIFYYLMEVKAEGSACIQIHNNHLEMWGKAEKDVYAMALENTPKLLKKELKNMENVLEELLMDNNLLGESSVPLYVLTNKQKLYGASCMLYPKTKSSNRTVPMTTRCEMALKKQLKQRQVILNKHNVKPIKGIENLIFLSAVGTPLNATTYSDAIGRLVETINVMKDPLEQMEKFSGHCFRHTFATRCFEAGIQAKTVQAYLGHATLQMTMDLYTHITDEYKQDEISKLESEENKIAYGENLYAV